MIDLTLLFLIVFTIALIFLRKKIIEKVMYIVLYVGIQYSLEYIYGTPSDFMMLLLMNVTSFLIGVLATKLLLKGMLKD